ncbi:hypothetical protein AB0I16_13745 [Streptomyces sp. NPDC050703]|uniref:hypothetical protein n=1 Tax=Streptomyces sp. NPDC050703 TaxID=3157218 RepID=UPI003438706A
MAAFPMAAGLSDRSDEAAGTRPGGGRSSGIPVALLALRLSSGVLVSALAPVAMAVSAVPACTALLGSSPSRRARTGS